MSTSNSYNYTQDRDTLIRGAFELVGVAIQGEDLDDDDITIANRVLNAMLKAWIVHGLQVWKRKVSIITPLVLDQQFYDLGSNQKNNVVAVGDGSTTVTITHNQHGFVDQSLVKILGATDDVDINGTFTITVVNTSSYTYTALAPVDSGTETGSVTARLLRNISIVKPERLLEVNRINSNNRTIMTELTNNEYRQLPDLTTSGTPIQFHYERRINSGRFYIWPVANASSVSNDTIELVYQIRIEDMDSSTDDLDMPQEWIEPVIYNLAHRLAPRYGTLNAGSRDRLKMDANEMLELAKNYDYEEGSVYLVPDMR